MMAHSCNPSIHEVEAGTLAVLGHPQLHKFEASLGYMNPCLKTTTKLGFGLVSLKPPAPPVIPVDKSWLGLEVPQPRRGTLSLLRWIPSRKAENLR